MEYIKPMFLLLFVLGIVAAVSSRHAAKHYPVEDAGNQDESSLVKKTLKRQGSSLTSAFDIGEEKNKRKDTKLHFKKPSKHLLELPKEISHSGLKKSAVQDSFSQRLFDDDGIRSLVIRNLTKESAFIQGMVSATLNANYYGAYMVQDIAYLRNAVNAFNSAAAKMRDQGQSEFEQFYRNESSVWESRYLAPMLTAWHLENTQNVQPGTAAQAYMSFLTDVSQQHAKYLAIAMLPCTMLWRWMADELFPLVQVNSAYYSWFNENKSSRPGYRGRLEIFVDQKFRSQEEYQKAKVFFCQAMVSELNFFRESGKENRYPLPPECQPGDSR